MPLNLGFLLYSFVSVAKNSSWRQLPVIVLCDCCVHVTSIPITLITIQLARAESLNFSSIRCLFCRLFMDMTDVHCSKIITEFDVLFRSWYKIYKNIKRNKLDNLVRAAAAKGCQGDSPGIWKTTGPHSHWVALHMALSS